MKFRTWFESQEQAQLPQVANVISKGADGLWITFTGSRQLFGPVASFQPSSVDNTGFTWEVRKKGNMVRLNVRVRSPQMGQQIAQKIKEANPPPPPPTQQVQPSMQQTGSVITLFRGMAGDYRPFKAGQNTAYNKPQSFIGSVTKAWEYAVKVSAAAARQGQNLRPVVIQIRIAEENLPPSHNTGMGDAIFDIPADELQHYGVRQLSDVELQQLLVKDQEIKDKQNVIAQNYHRYNPPEQKPPGEDKSFYLTLDDS